MKFDFSNANVFNSEILKGNCSVLNMPFLFNSSVDSTVIDISGYDVLPAFIDVHVHFREPGFSYKETIKTGSMAAARGGFYGACTMPNLKPAPDSLENLKVQLGIIERDSVIRTVPFGCITRGEMGKELADLRAMAPYVCGFSDDGRGVDNEGLMREAMEIARSLGKVISAHCEDGSCIKDSKEAEWKQIERDIKLADQIKCKYHVCHISTKESVELIRDAKKSGVDITCETAPHYLVFTDAEKEDSGRFKMNPPIRDDIDRDALINGIIDGTIDMIATDHAPHSIEEKEKPITEAPSGIIGLETSLALGITNLEKPGHLSLMQLMEKMSKNPAKLYGLPYEGIAAGAVADLVIFHPDEIWTVETFATKSCNSPFKGHTLQGKVHYTICEGKVVYEA